MAAKDGPFGFAMGMTAQEVKAAVGSRPLHEEGTFMVFSGAPKPHSQLSNYMVLVSPQLGLCKVVGMSEVASNRFGHQIDEQVQLFVKALTGKYGEPTWSRDKVFDGSIWNDPEDYMMGLLEKDRVVSYIWESDKRELPGDIRAIAVTAEGLSTDKANVTVGYEFTNMAKCVEESKQESDAAL